MKRKVKQKNVNTLLDIPRMWEDACPSLYSYYSKQRGKNLDCTVWKELLTDRINS